MVISVCVLQSTNAITIFLECWPFSSLFNYFPYLVPNFLLSVCNLLLFLSILSMCSSRETWSEEDSVLSIGDLASS